MAGQVSQAISFPHAVRMADKAKAKAETPGQGHVRKGTI